MQGLTSDEVRIRQKQYGSNTLAEQARAHPVRIFFSQFTDIMVLILLAAAVISWLLGEYADAVTIAVIAIIFMSGLLPYFSSSIGPTSRMTVKLLMKCE